MRTGQIKTAAITGALAVALGAFGSHGLKPFLNAEQWETFRTASQYHFLHVIPMLMIALRRGEHHPALDQSFVLWFVGLICFSGSLYVFSILPTLGAAPLPGFGLITPLGGLLLIGAWLNLLRYKPHKHDAHHQTN